MVKIFKVSGILFILSILVDYLDGELLDFDDAGAAQARVVRQSAG